MDWRLIVKLSTAKFSDWSFYQLPFKSATMSHCRPLFCFGAKLKGLNPHLNFGWTDCRMEFYSQIMLNIPDWVTGWVKYWFKPKKKNLTNNKSHSPRRSRLPYRRARSCHAYCGAEAYEDTFSWKQRYCGSVALPLSRIGSATNKYYINDQSVL